MCFSMCHSIQTPSTEPRQDLVGVTLSFGVIFCIFSFYVDVWLYSYDYYDDRAFAPDHKYKGMFNSATTNTVCTSFISTRINPHV